MLLTRKPSHDAKAALLARVPGFAGCRDRDLVDLARHLDERRIPAGTVLTREGSLGHEAFLIVEGRASVHFHGQARLEVGAGELVGEMAMVDHLPRTATVVAETDLHVLVIGPLAFDEFTAHPAVSRIVARTLAGRLRRAEALAY